MFLQTTIFLVGKALRIRVRWTVVYVPAHAGHVHPGPRPSTVLYPGITVFLPGNALQQPLLIVLERLGNVRFRVSPCTFSPMILPFNNALQHRLVVSISLLEYGLPHRRTLDVDINCQSASSRRGLHTPLVHCGDLDHANSDDDDNMQGGEHDGDDNASDASQEA